MHRSVRCFLVLFLLICATTCNKNDDPTGPTSSTGTTAEVKGVVNFPSTAGIDVKTVTVALGETETPLDTAGSFKVTGRRNTPGLIWAAGADSVPLLMAAVPRPEAAGNVTLDAASTALALVYMHPLVCGGTAEEADPVVARLRTLPEFAAFETLLRQKLTANPRSLAIDDNALSSAIGSVVIAYLNSIQFPALPKILQKMNTTAADIIAISPTTPVSGHELKYLSGETFSLSNAYGRWAYAVTPTDEFFLFPNGSLLDALRNKLPWAPSLKEFNTTTPPAGDSIFIKVYGLGWKKDPTNVWDDLTSAEQLYVMRAGFSTIMFELVPHIISFYTNNAHLHASPEHTKGKVIKALSHLFNDTRSLDRCVMYIRTGDYGGLVWFLAKWTLGKIVNDEQFRQDYLPETLLNLSTSSLKNLAKAAHIGLQAALVAESITSIAKTYVGIEKARFKTQFKVWREITEFGSIAGTVHDKANGTPIGGAVVNVRGDEGNPMNPPHQATTGADGGFLFQNIAVGTKTLEVSKSGYGNASVSVTVTKAGTASVSIELTKDVGRVTGTVLNDIYRKNNVTPAHFKGESTIEVIDLSGATATASYWVYDGSYSLNLPAATYRVIAWHDDYRPDTVQVTVQKNATTTAPDLVLEPLGYIAGEIRIDMNMDGIDDFQYQYTDSTIACIVANDFGTCPDGNRGPVIWIGNWPPIVGLDAVSLVIDPAVVTNTGIFSIGGIDLIACPGAGIAATMDFRTTRAFCQDPSIGAVGPMAFTALAGGTSNACNCGIDDPGRVILDEYGTALASPIEGQFNGTLAGWKKCECDGGATSNCATAYVSVRFRVLVGAQ